MGRKIPAKKHHGVKDPLQQQAKRLQKLKGKINAPPRDPDEQPVPRSLLRLFPTSPALAPHAQHAQRQARHGDRQQKPRQRRDVDSGAERKGTSVSRLKRAPGESGRAFSLRINSAVRALHGSAAGHDSQQYPLDEDERDARGERMEALRRHRAKRDKAKLKRQAGPKPGASASGAPGPQDVPRAQSRAARRAALLKAKMASAAQASEAARAEVRYERVHFGDVAHAPPHLLRDKGLRRGLLSAALLAGHAGHAVGAGELHAEERRLAAVSAYRALKAHRQQQQQHKHKHKPTVAARKHTPALTAS